MGIIEVVVGAVFTTACAYWLGHAVGYRDATEDAVVRIEARRRAAR